jgi:hypothetical protein
MSQPCGGLSSVDLCYLVTFPQSVFESRAVPRRTIDFLTVRAHIVDITRSFAVSHEPLPSSALAGRFADVSGTRR